jgi:polyadenylate-binding protein 2
MEQQHEEQEHEVYGGEIPDEGEMDADVEMSTRVEDEDLQDPNSKVPFPSINIRVRVCRCVHK